MLKKKNEKETHQIHGQWTRKNAEELMAIRKKPFGLYSVVLMTCTHKMAIRTPQTLWV